MAFGFRRSAIGLCQNEVFENYITSELLYKNIADKNRLIRLYQLYLKLLTVFIIL